MKVHFQNIYVTLKFQGHRIAIKVKPLKSGRAQLCAPSDTFRTAFCELCLIVCFLSAQHCWLCACVIVIAALNLI